MKFLPKQYNCERFSISFIIIKEVIGQFNTNFIIFNTKSFHYCCYHNSVKKYTKYCLYIYIYMFYTFIFVIFVQDEECR